MIARPGVFAPESPTATTVVRQRFVSLQIFRGFAALWVLWYHVGMVANMKLGTPFLGDVFRHGHLGVPFFFVLSGFIICLVHRRDIGHPATARRFLLKRFWRVYPLLFVVTCGYCLLILLLGPGVSATPLTLYHVVSSLLLLPQAGFPLVSVAWTLTYEVFFYSVFLLVILLGSRGGLGLFLGWTAGIVLFNLPGMPVLDWLPAFLFNPYDLQFLTGCCAAYVFATWTLWPQTAWTCVVAGCAMVAIGCLFYERVAAWPKLTERFFWAVAFGSLVLGATSVESRLQRPFPRSLRVLGDASYSIYLIHLNVQTVLALLLLRLGWMARWNAQWMMALIGGLSLLAGLLLWRFVEKPLLGLMNRPKSGP